jgi:uncharacterized protein
MRLSRFNIVSPIAGTDLSYIVNLLSGHADVLEADEATQLTEPGDEFPEEFAERGYVVDPVEEERRYRKAYLDFVDGRDTDEIQLFYVPSYACNFNCSYCYQKSYETPKDAVQEAVLESFFSYVDQKFSNRKKYVTLFGGEPLLPNESSRRIVNQMVKGTLERGLDLAIVTNGYHLASYVESLARGRIREIQVTLDGPKAIHDGRRHLMSGGSTFDAIVAGVEATLAQNIAVNLRTVIDRDNLPAYVELAHFAIERGWTNHPKFKTQIVSLGDRTPRDSGFSSASLFDCAIPKRQGQAAKSVVRCMSGHQDGVGFRLHGTYLQLYGDRWKSGRIAWNVLS